MKKPKKWFWLRDGWNWIDRTFFFTAGVIALATTAGHLLWLIRPSGWNADAWSALANGLQAIFSVAGIWAGFLMVKVQLEGQRRDAEERAKEASQEAKARCFQMFMARLHVTRRFAQAVTLTLNETSPHWLGLAALSKEVDRAIDLPSGEEFTPAVHAAVGAVKSQNAVIRVLVELALADPSDRPPEALTVARESATRLTHDLDIAVVWAQKELDEALSDDDRAELRRALQHLET